MQQTEPAVKGGRLLRSLALAAPLVFALHVLEEAPGFVAWFNRLVEPDITQELFVAVNVAGFAITLGVAAALAVSRDVPAALLALAWFGFLFLANAVLHLGATAVLGRYSPGTVTAALLYLPYFVLLWRAVVGRLGVRWPVAAAVTLLGALPMLAHGWLIVFRGSRLF